LSPKEKQGLGYERFIWNDLVQDRNQRRAHVDKEITIFGPTKSEEFLD
jgi:hypothetical protein